MSRTSPGVTDNDDGDDIGSDSDKNTCAPCSDTKQVFPSEKFDTEEFKTNTNISCSKTDKKNVVKDNSDDAGSDVVKSARPKEHIVKVRKGCQ